MVGLILFRGDMETFFMRFCFFTSISFAKPYPKRQKPVQSQQNNVIVNFEQAATNIQQFTELFLGRKKTCSKPLK